MDPPPSPPATPPRIPTSPPLHFPPNLLHTGFLELLRVFRASSQPSSSVAVLDRIRLPNTAQDAEVSIRIIRADEHSGMDDEADVPRSVPSSLPSSASSLPLMVSEEGTGSRGGSLTQSVPSEIVDSEPVVNQRYDLQVIWKWMEQVLPFCLLLLTVFIRQHLQGFLLMLWLSITMIKSNDFLKKQAALKGERKSKLIVINAVVLLLQVLAVYWWCRKDDILRPLMMFPPRKIPEFWHAVFIIMMNDVMVRQGAMILKSGLLIYYKNRRGHNYRLQGQLLTLVEYLLLFYRALLPIPVWYRFFLNKDYGSFFSSLTTGLYLTFKLTSVLEKIKLFITAVKALSRKEMQYGTYATPEEVIAAGDICAICQEKIHAPILLTCKHLFCEDCVCEWLERERTCPLCRALVKPADLKSFGDGSTSIFYQLF